MWIRVVECDVEFDVLMVQLVPGRVLMSHLQKTLGSFIAGSKTPTGRRRHAT